MLDREHTPEMPNIENLRVNATTTDTGVTTEESTMTDDDFAPRRNAFMGALTLRGGNVEEVPRDELEKALPDEAIQQQTEVEGELDEEELEAFSEMEKALEKFQKSKQAQTEERKYWADLRKEDGNLFMKGECTCNDCEGKGCGCCDACADMKKCGCGCDGCCGGMRHAQDNGIEIPAEGIVMEAEGVDVDQGPADVPGIGEALQEAKKLIDDLMSEDEDE